MTNEGNRDIKLIAWVFLVVGVFSVALNLFGLVYYGFTGEGSDNSQHHFWDLAFWLTIFTLFQDGFCDLIRVGIYDIWK